MSAIGKAVKDAFTDVAGDAKIKSLKEFTVEPTASSELTTDFGIKVQDTDNWYVVVASLI